MILTAELECVCTDWRPHYQEGHLHTKCPWWAFWRKARFKCTHKPEPPDPWYYPYFYTYRRCSCCGIRVGYGSQQLRQRGRHVVCMVCR